MRKSGIDASMMDLGRLLQLIDDGGLALPDFQRDFDWSTDDIEALLVTVISSWPAGSLLLMEAGREIFQLRGLEGGPSLSSSPSFVLLDGQQRLTSLYQALFNRGPRVYAIKVDGLSNRSDLEDAVVSYTRTTWDREYSDMQAQAKHSIVPFYALATATGFFEWRDEVVEHASSSESTQLRRQLTSIYSNLLSAIHSYEFPVVKLEKTIAPQAIARIFERVNRLGVALGAFDLMVARLYETNWNLRHKWNEAKRERPVLDIFQKDDGIPVLQVIALRSAGNVRRSAVLDLERREVHNGWETAAAGVANAGEFLQDHCGVADQGMLPYGSLLLLLGAISVDHSLQKNSDILKALFWSKTFGQSYDVAANTRVVADYADLKRHFTTDSGFDLPSVDPAELFNAARRTHRAVWAAFASLLENRNPAGFLRRLTAPLNQRSTGDSKALISLFPRGLESESPNLAPPHLRVLSLVDVPRPIAKMMAKEGFVPLLRRFSEEVGEDEVNRELRASILPNLDQCEQTINDWRAFMKVRHKILSKVLVDLGVRMGSLPEDLI